MFQNEMKKFMKVVIVTASLFGSTQMVLAQELTPGTVGGGGGEAYAAHMGQVAKNAIKKLKLICSSSSEPEDVKVKSACGWLPLLEKKTLIFKIYPYLRDTVRGADGQPRDAGNDGKDGFQIILDIDRWADKQNEDRPNMIKFIRGRQIHLALHETAVLVGAEENDQYVLSDFYLEMIEKEGFDLNQIVAQPIGNFAPRKPEISCVRKIVRPTCKVERTDKYEGNQTCWFSYSFEYTNKTVTSHNFSKSNPVRMGSSAGNTVLHAIITFGIGLAIDGANHASAADEQANSAASLAVQAEFDRISSIGMCNGANIPTNNQ